MKYENFFEKIKESLLSIFPVCMLVILINLTPLVDFTKDEIFLFAVSGIALVLGMALFNLGAELSMSPMGKFVGMGLVKSKKLSRLLIVAFIMGLFITIAEPDLSVLAKQLSSAVNPSLLVYFVGIGVGLFLLLAVAKIVFKRDLTTLLLFFYFVLFSIVSLVISNENTDLVALAFDSGGVTTGPITVPFIMALGLGIATSFGDKSENSFGLISLCSIGPVLAVMLLAVFTTKKIDYQIANYSIEVISLASVLEVLLHTFINVTRAVGIVFGLFFILNLLFFKIPRSEIIKILNGLLITVLGLVIFLSAVEVGFMPIGYKMGLELASSSKPLLIAFGFVLGAVVVLAEPAVHVLNAQVEEVTKGLVTQRAMIIALCSGVGISIGLSMLRIVLDFSVLYYLIPGYLISLGLSILVPKIYTGIAFDSGGVASGPLTSCFILPFAIGACVCLQGEEKVLSDAFGIVAMVALTPLITIQSLGFSSLAKKFLRQRKAIKKIYSSDDRQVIRF